MAGFAAEEVNNGKRYRIRIDDVNYYVWLSDTSVSVSYAFENREEQIKTRTILEKFCVELSRIMKQKNEEREDVQQTA